MSVCVVLRGGMLPASPWETSELLGLQLPASQSQHQQTCRQSSPGSGWFGWGCGVEVGVWVVWGTADAQVLLPDSLPYLPVKEQKELLGGCLQGRQLPQWAWLRRAAKIPGKEGSLGHQHWLEGWNLTVVFCQGKDHCFLSGTEAIVPGDFVSPVSRGGLGWACPGDSSSLCPWR